MTRVNCRILAILVLKEYTRLHFGVYPYELIVIIAHLMKPDWKFEPDDFKSFVFFKVEDHNCKSAYDSSQAADEDFCTPWIRTCLLSNVYGNLTFEIHNLNRLTGNWFCFGIFNRSYGFKANLTMISTMDRNMQGR